MWAADRSTAVSWAADTVPQEAQAVFASLGTHWPATDRMSSYLPVLTYLPSSSLQQLCHLSGIPAASSLIQETGVYGAPGGVPGDGEQGEQAPHQLLGNGSFYQRIEV